jgi:hypothetical protein
MQLCCSSESSDKMNMASSSYFQDKELSLAGYCTISARTGFSLFLYERSGNLLLGGFYIEYRK